VADLLYEQLLRCTTGGSNKEYRLIILPDAASPGNTTLEAHSRPIGAGWVYQGMKKKGTLFQTMKEAEKIAKSKVAKGYRVMSTIDKSAEAAASAPPEPTSAKTRPAKPAPTPEPEKVHSGFQAQLLNAIDEEAALLLLYDDSWCMQEKHDGRHLSIRRDKHGLVGINKLGFIVPLDEKVAEAVELVFPKAKALDLLLDGELMGWGFAAYDLLQIGTADLRPMGYTQRVSLLGRFLNAAPTPCLRLTETWEWTDAKVAAYAEIKARKGEGVVFKKRNAPYTPGRPNSGGDMLKFKHTATATFLCLGSTGKRSVKLGLIGQPWEKPLVEMGSCTIPPNKEVPAENALIEIRYLYCFKGGKVYQPFFIGLRDDVLVQDCTTAQLKYKAGEADEDAA